MVTHSDPINVSPSMLRKLARDNQEIGRKLAQYEFNAIISELADQTVFDLEIDFTDEPAGDPQTPLLFGDFEARNLPRLNVTSGTTSWHNSPQDLPVIGIYCPDISYEIIRRALSALLTAQFTTPFARFVFLCENLRIVPFLGRYQFTYEYLAQHSPMDMAQRLNMRFGMTEMRHLVSSEKLWRAPRLDTVVQPN